MLIGVAGMVGSGKSTLTRALATRFGLQQAMESVDTDNPWLELFYADDEKAMRANALQLQLHFLATRFESMRRMRAAGGSWILDRTWYEDAEIFARGHFEEGLMSSVEWELYQRLYLELLQSPTARPPQLLIYLHAPLETIVQRIRLRGRPKEKDTAKRYWAALHARYDRWIRRFDACPVLSLDVREYDLVGDVRTIDSVAQRVRERLEPMLPQTEMFLAV